MSANEPALPKARKAGPLERGSQFLFEDSNAELTLNLLKIRPQEEVKLIRQSNSEFFEELQRNHEQCEQKLSESNQRRDSIETSNMNDMAYAQHQSTSESD